MFSWILGGLGVFFATLAILWLVFIGRERAYARQLGFEPESPYELPLGFEYRDDRISRAYVGDNRIVYRTDIRHLLGLRRFSDDVLRSWVVSFEVPQLDVPRTIISRTTEDLEELPAQARAFLAEIPEGIDRIVLIGSHVHVAFGTRLRTLDQLARRFPFVDALERSLHGKKTGPVSTIEYPSLQKAIPVRAFRGIALFALNSFATTLLATALVISSSFVIAAGVVLLSLPLIQQAHALLLAVFSITASIDRLLVPASIGIFAVTSYLTYFDTPLSVPRRLIAWIMGLLAIPFIILSVSLFTIMPNLPHRWIFLTILTFGYLVVFAALIGIVGLGYLHRSVHQKPS
ncbi:MAG: hypothetical protein ACMXYM_05235 [Candidatus Woesearchaeota archaeon]